MGLLKQHLAMRADLGGGNFVSQAFADYEVVRYQLEHNLNEAALHMPKSLGLRIVKDVPRKLDAARFYAWDYVRGFLAFDHTHQPISPKLKSAFETSYGSLLTPKDRDVIRKF